MLPTSDRDLTARLERLLRVILLAFGVVTIGLVYWGIVRADALLARDDNPRPIEAEMRIQRGRILDGQDRVMAGTEGEPNRLRRVYPLTTTGPAVGYYSLRHGADGIETSFDAYLRGDADDDWARYWQRVLHIPSTGRDIRLTLDATLQDQATTRMGDQTGALVVLRLGEGDEPAAIRAMVSRPGYDSNRLDEQFEQLTSDPASPLLNRAALGLYQPGLTLSPLLIAAALDQERLAADETPAEVAVPVPIDGYVLQCAELPQPDSQAPTWLELIALGCPAPLVDLGQRLGIETLETILAEFGLRSRPALPIATAAGLAEAIVDPGMAAVGQDQLTVTPLQLARAYAVLGQDGTLPPLQLVGALQDEAGQWQATFDGEPATRPIGPASAARVLSSLSPYGEGRELSAVALAGPEGGTNSWYVGMTPGGRPDTIVVVVLENAEDPSAATAIGRDVLGLAAVTP